MIVDLIVGAGVFAAGQLSGRFIRRKPKPDRIVDPEPKCGCGHHIAFHEAGVNRCHGKNPYVDGECTCQAYVGPQPLPTYVMGQLPS